MSTRGIPLDRRDRDDATVMRTRRVGSMLGLRCDATKSDRVLAWLPSGLPILRLTLSTDASAAERASYGFRRMSTPSFTRLRRGPEPSSAIAKSRTHLGEANPISGTTRSRATSAACAGSSETTRITPATSRPSPASATAFSRFARRKDTPNPVASDA